MLEELTYKFQELCKKDDMMPVKPSDSDKNQRHTETPETKSQPAYASPGQNLYWFFRHNKAVVVLGMIKYLVCQHQHCFHGKTTRAEIEQVLQTGSKQVHD